MAGSAISTDLTFEQRRLWAGVFLARWGVIAVFGLLPFIDQSIPKSLNNTNIGLGVAVALLGVVFPLDIFYRYWLVTRHRLPVSVPFTDMAAIVAVVALEPELVEPSLMIMITVSAIWAAAFDRVTAMLAAAWGLACVSIVIAQANTTIDPAFVFFFAIAVGLAVWAVGVISVRNRQVHADFDQIVKQANVVVWNQPDAEIDAFELRGATQRLSGRPTERWRRPSTLQRLVAEPDQQRRKDALAEADDQGQCEVEYSLQTSDGHIMRVIERIRVDTDTDGTVVSRRGLIFDVTDRWRVQARAHRFAEVVSKIPTAVFIVSRTDDNEIVLLDANTEAEVLTRINLDAHVGQQFVSLADFGDMQVVEDALRQVIETGETIELDEYRTGGDDARTFAVHLFPLPGDSACLAVQDITKRSDAAAAMRRMALEDPLTELPNRNQLMTRLADEVRQTERTGLPFSLLLINLDGFAAVNTAAGHATGDRILIEAADRIRSVVAERFFCCRLGGDLFGVLVRQSESGPIPEDLATYLSDRLDRPFQELGTMLPMSATIGIATHPHDSETPDDLLRHAEFSVTLARQRGEHVALYDADRDPTSLRKVSLSAELRSAIESDDLVLHFQPAIDVRSGLPLRAEALVRWIHPELGLLPPNEFIPMAEATGLIQLLTRWVVLHAILHAQRWDQLGLGISIAVNLAVSDLHRPDFAGWLTRLLASYDVPPSRFVVEITESEVMSDPAAVIDTLNELRSAGIRVAIDDFGTGYASLGYLRDLPMDEVKLDRSFIEHLATSERDQAIVGAAIDLAHKLGATVVAEGVEDDAALTKLRSLGCDEAQGYLICRPIPADDLEQWIVSQRVPTRVAPLPEETPRP